LGADPEFEEGSYPPGLCRRAMTVTADPPTRARLHLLLVEDNPGDVRLLQETLRDSPWPIDLKVARDGADALRYMRREEHHAAAIRPDLVLLDLNLPGMDGRQVLAEVRSDVRLNGIPVVIFTSSPADDDVLLAFNFHAEGYLRKPVRLEEFNQLLDRLEIGM
jgi:chemotaxis family two-component system response regulator Rcp1